MGKQRINWTLDKSVLELLGQAKKLSPNNTSISKLVEHAVRKVFKNKKESLQEYIKHYQRRLMYWSDKLKELEEE